MSVKEFYKKLGILTATLTIIIFMGSKIPALASSLWFSIAVIALFAILSAAIYYLGKRTVHDTNKTLFMAVAISSIFIKIALTLAILFTYQASAKPTTKLYLFPFLGIYLSYTIFETWVMMRLSKSDHPSNQ